MKKILFALVALTLLACERQPKTFILEPGTMINIKPDLAAWTRSGDSIPADSGYLEPIEIVRQTIGLSFMNYALNDSTPLDRGFAPFQRDTISEIPSLKMFASDIINQLGEYVPEFIEAEDCILFRALNNKRDTIAYIPNAVMREAETAIKIAYDAQDYEEVYRLFNEAFTFLPITGPEWRALEKPNSNQ